MKRERPIGVTIIAVLAIIVGVLQLLGSLALFGLSAVSLPGFEYAALVSTLGVAGGVVMFVMAALMIAFGVGALMLKSWAWFLGVVLFGISLISAVVTMLTVGFEIGVLLSAAIALAILVYLFTPNVRAAFGRGHTGTPATTGRGPVVHT